VRWHAEGKDLVFKAVVLKLLVEVALMAVQNEQPVPPPPDAPLYACQSASTTLD
jgi:hypothetical protein